MTDKIHDALQQIADMANAALRDYPQVKHWASYRRIHLIGAAAYDRDGGSSSEIRDLSGVVDRRDEGTQASKRFMRAVGDAHRALLTIDHIRRDNLTAVSLPAVIDDEQPCAHCGQEARYRGDLGSRCYQWKRRNAGALPGPDVLEAWRRGKQPKVRVG